MGEDCRTSSWPPPYSPTTQFLPALLDSKQAARLLNVSERTVTRLCKGGKINAVQVGGQWRMNRDELLKRFGIVKE